MKFTNKLLSTVLAIMLTISFGTQIFAADVATATDLSLSKTLNTVLLNDKPLNIDLVTYYISGETVMLPIRQVGEALGFSVDWEDSKKGVMLDDGIVKSTLYIGTDSYFMASSTAIGTSKPSPLGVAPILVGDKTYVPANFFAMLYGKDATVEVKDSILKITRGEHFLKTNIQETKVDGTPINLIPFTVYFDGKNQLIPLDIISNILSFKVTQNEDENVYLLDNGTAKTTIYMGIDSYFKASSKAIGMSSPTQFGTAPQMISDTVYVPTQLFDLLCKEETITFDGSTMLVKTK